MAVRSGSGGGSGGEKAGADKFKSSGTGGSSGSGGSVYMGTPQGPGFVSPYAPEGVTGQAPASPLILGTKDALKSFDSFSQKQLRDFIAAGQVGGILSEEAGPIEAYNLWKKLVTRSEAYTAAGRKISPMDVLQMYVKGVTGKGGSAWSVQYRGGRKFLVNSVTGEVKYQGPRFETTYQKRIDLTDPVTAKAIATSVFQQLMHRDPGKGELESWGHALRSAEQQSPVVDTTTTEYDMDTGEAIGTSTESEGGLTADAKMYMAQQRIKATKEYGAVQAATTLTNALEDAVFNNPYGSL